MEVRRSEDFSLALPCNPSNCFDYGLLGARMRCVDHFFCQTQKAVALAILADNDQGN